MYSYIPIIAFVFDVTPHNLSIYLLFFCTLWLHWCIFYLLLVVGDNSYLSIHFIISILHNHSKYKYMLTMLLYMNVSTTNVVIKYVLVVNVCILYWQLTSARKTGEGRLKGPCGLNIVTENGLSQLYVSDLGNLSIQIYDL